jgi:hypothetical protein
MLDAARTAIDEMHDLVIVDQLPASPQAFTTRLNGLLLKAKPYLRSANYGTEITKAEAAIRRFQKDRDGTALQSLQDAVAGLHISVHR